MVSSNLMASNLGAIVKRGTNNSFHFAVTNILNTNTEANAKVTLYNFQQQPVASKTTDADGFTIIDSDANAYFALVEKGNNTSYVKLNEGNSLSLSKFDVSGKTLQRGLKGFIYGERGVWRPGDTLHLTFMLNDNANPLPKRHPIKLEITDPNGKLVYKNVTSDNLNNFYKFTVPTSTEDKTGNYNAKVSVGGATFYKGLKIVSKTPKEQLIQYVITQSKNDIFQNEALDIYFEGTFAIITLNEDETLKSIYIGEGEKLSYKNEYVTTNSLKSYYKDYSK